MGFAEYKAVGLELAEIRHPFDLGVMEPFFGTAKERSGLE